MSAAVLCSLAVAIAGMLAIHAISTQIVDSVSVGSLDGSFSFVATKGNLREDDYFKLRQDWRRGEVPGVQGLVPVIEGFMDAQGRLVRLIGADWLADSSYEVPASLVVATDTRFINTDSVVYVGPPRPDSGVQSIGRADLLASIEGYPERFLADISTAQDLLGRSGEIDAIWIRTGGNDRMSWLDSWIPGATSGLRLKPEPPTVPGYVVTSTTSWNPTIEFANAILFNLSALSVLAFVVGGFILYQAVRLNVSRREVELSRLEALGVSRAMQKVLFLLDNFLLLLLAYPVAVAVALAFLATLAYPTGEGILPEVPAVAHWKSVLVALVVVSASTSIALTPSRDRGAVLKRSAAALLAGAMIVWGLRPASGLAGGFAVLLGFCVVHVTLLVPAAWKILSLLSQRLNRFSLLRRSGIRSAAGMAAEVRLSLNALSLALATAVGVALMVDSFRADFDDLLDIRLAPGIHAADAVDVDVDALAHAFPDAELHEYHRGYGLLTTGSVTVVAAELDEWELARYGSASDVPNNGALVNKIASSRHGLRLGDDFDLELHGQRVSLTVAHIFEEYGSATGRLVVDRGAIPLDQLVRDRLTVVTRRDEGNSVIQWIRDRYPTVAVRNQTEIRQSALNIFDRTFAMTRSMTWLVIGVAVLGLASAFYSMQGRRHFEFRLLRALGVHPRETVRSTLEHAAILGAVTIVLALPLSFAIAWALSDLVNPRAFGWEISLKVIVGSLLTPIGIAMAASLVVGALPVHRWQSEFRTDE